MTTPHIQKAARAMAEIADQEDYMEDWARYDARAKAALSTTVEPSESEIDATLAAYAKSDTVGLRQTIRAGLVAAAQARVG